MNELRRIVPGTIDLERHVPAPYILDKPMLVIDSQVHIYTQDCAAYPWASSATGMIEHAKRAAVGMAPSVTAEDLLQDMDRLAIDGAVLVSFGAVYGFDNRYALDAAARYPGRFAVVGRLDPASPTVAADVAAFAARPGAVGVRVLVLENGAERLRAGAFDPMFAAAEAQGLPLCIYAHGATGELHRVAEAYPRLQIVLDHMCLDQQAVELGRDPFATLPAVLELARHPNVAAKLSALATLSARPFPFEDLWPPIHRIVAAFGPERLMWGTDTTRTRLAYREETDFLRQSNELSQADKALMLGQSLQRIFKWSPRTDRRPES